ncbi:hypothetical protein LJC00_04460, partial [Dysgonomonas sp. OttesenSCG-928-M03]|nr:hypothetical protein [Dysgonomonas sp. OttesenSCG-928-M03]
AFNPLSYATEAPNIIGRMYKLVQDAQREYLSVFDQSQHDTLTALELYNEEYIAKERKRIETLTSVERESAEKKLKIQIDFAKHMQIFYRDRDKVNDTYFEDNLIDPVGNIANGTLGKFPMDTKKKAELDTKGKVFLAAAIENYTKRIRDWDYTYRNVLPETIVYGQVPEKKQNTKKSEKKTETAEQLQKKKEADEARRKIDENYQKDFEKIVKVILLQSLLKLLSGVKSLFCRFLNN